MKTRREQIFLAGILAGAILAGCIPVSVQAAVTDGKTLVQNLNTAPDYYIFSESQIRELSDQEVQSLDAAGRQMAINEIYARRGRKFLLPEVQRYFDGKNWYKGVVDSASFNEEIFNEYEEKNIEKLMGVSDSSYFLEGSNSRYLTDEEVKGLTRAELQLGINEIYARRGRKFAMKEYQNYFSGKSWYSGTIEPQNFNDGVFNAYEIANIQKLTAAMGKIDADRTGIIENFAGCYVLDKEGLGVVVEISIYDGQACASASAGEEVGSVMTSVQIGSGGVSTTQGYLYKEGENTYSVSGGDLMGAYLQVLSNGVVITGLGGLDGTYTLVERY